MMLIGSEVVEAAADLMQNKLDEEIALKERKSQTVTARVIAAGMLLNSINCFSLCRIIFAE